MKTEVIKYAKELGFNDIGFTNVDVTNWYVPRINKFFAKKLDCTLSIDKNKLLGQKQLQEKFKSVISVVVAYPYKKESTKIEEGTAYFSASSAGLDYHIVVKEKLDKLALFLKKNYDINSLTQVDNGDFDDRYWAYKSGLGMYGKNGMLIHKELGSFIFLGELFIDRVIESDFFVEQSCCGCNECIRRCPTNSITNGNMTIDSKTCLSYLSQAKEKILGEFGKQFSSIYGCDICQQVCPHNSGSVQTTFWGNTNLEKVKLLEFIRLSNKDFKKKYGHLAGAWRGKLVLVRNALWILANRQFESIGQIIDEFLKDKQHPEWFLDSLKEIKNTWQL